MFQNLIFFNLGPAIQAIALPWLIKHFFLQPSGLLQVFN